MPENNIEGLRELSRKLEEIGGKVAGKALRQAAMNATTPALKAIKMAAPVGTRAHKTYKGRLVAPGFLKRSIKRKSRLTLGRAVITIGVLAEAFYGVSFLEGGTKHADPKPFLVRSFIRNRRVMETRLAAQLREKIEKIAKSKR